MKAIEHKREMKKVVERKNKEIDNVKAVMQEAVDFWHEESGAWLERASRADNLLGEVLIELENLFNAVNNNQIIDPNEELMAKIREHLSQIYH